MEGAGWKEGSNGGNIPYQEPSGLQKAAPQMVKLKHLERFASVLSALWFHFCSEIIVVRPLLRLLDQYHVHVICMVRIGGRGSVERVTGREGGISV